MSFDLSKDVDASMKLLVQAKVAEETRMLTNVMLFLAILLLAIIGFLLAFIARRMNALDASLRKRQEELRLSIAQGAGRLFRDSRVGTLSRMETPNSAAHSMTMMGRPRGMSGESEDLFTGIARSVHRKLESSSDFEMSAGVSDEGFTPESRTPSGGFVFDQRMRDNTLTQQRMYDTNFDTSRPDPSNAMNKVNMEKLLSVCQAPKDNVNDKPGQVAVSPSFSLRIPPFLRSSKFELMEQLTDECKATCLANMRNDQFTSGHVIVESGQIGRHMFFMERGSAKVIFDGSPFTEVKNGEFFGEATFALILSNLLKYNLEQVEDLPIRKDFELSCDVVANENCRCWIFDVNDFLDVYTSDLEGNQKLLKILPDAFAPIETITSGKDGAERENRRAEEGKKAKPNIQVDAQKEKPSSAMPSSQSSSSHKSGSILEEFIRSASSSDGNGRIRSPMLVRDRDEDSFKRVDGRTPKWGAMGGKNTSPYRLDDLMGASENSIRSAIDEEDLSFDPSLFAREVPDSDRVYRRETSGKLSSESIGILPFSRSPSAGFCEKLSSSMEPDVHSHVRTMVSPRRTVSPRRGGGNDRYQERSDEAEAAPGIMPFDRSMSSGSQGEGIMGKNDVMRRAPTSSSGLSSPVGRDSRMLASSGSRFYARIIRNETHRGSRDSPDEDKKND